MAELFDYWCVECGEGFYSCTPEMGDHDDDLKNKGHHIYDHGDVLAGGYVGDALPLWVVGDSTNPPHPMQPLVIDADGVVHFRRNEFVRFLLEAGPFDLNDLRTMPLTHKFPESDYTHLMQLIGYSVSGYCGLSTTPPHLARQADAMVVHLVSGSEKGQTDDEEATRPDEESATD